MLPVTEPVRVKCLDDSDALGSVYNVANLPLGYFEADGPITVLASEAN